ncbi:MAG: PQQ-like beta-propeller repeat protein [Phycisphaerae bacterium]|nr:PQQ-like beta-propeller repeat protein [Phycisphaerae bacterium]
MQPYTTFVLATACLMIGTHAPAQDWPQWGGSSHHNMISAAQHLTVSFNPGKLKSDASAQSQVDMASTQGIKWAVRLGSHTYGNTVVADGRVFVGTNDASLRDPRLKPTRGGLILCLDEDSGELLWQLPVPRFRTTLKDFNYDDMNLGVCASVTVEGNRAYVVSNRGEVLCLDVEGQANGNEGPFMHEAQFMSDKDNPDFALQATDADIVWTYDMVASLPCWPQDASSSAVLIYGDYLYVGTSNGVDNSHSHVPYPDAPSLIVLDKKTGQLVAQDNEKIGRTLFHGQWSSPCLGMANGTPQILYGAGNGLCYAFKPFVEPDPTDPVATLNKLWSCDCNPTDTKSQPYQRGKYRTFQSGFYGQGPSEIIGTPVFHNNRVYVTVGQDTMHGRGPGALTCINASNGHIVWQSRDIDRSLATVSVKDGLVYVTDYSGYIHCLDAQTGRHLWKQDTNSPLWSSTLVADDKIFVGTENRDFWILQAGRDMKVLNKIRFPHKIYNAPIIANGVLYIATERHLYAIDNHDH